MSVPPFYLLVEVSPSASSFLHALLQKTYHTHQLSISLKILEFMAAQPNTLFFVSYDYPLDAQTATQVNFRVEPLENMNEKMRNPYSTRLLRSRGLLTLHAVVIGQDATTHALRLAPFVLRTTSSRFFDGLTSIVVTGPETFGPSELEDVVRDLIVETDAEDVQFC
ncbi:hypothetical protein FB45DRAFT_1047119 [Roridomyces roridus]|uniref:Uncharacterized protein n=1 Tax=Roridomyces roridus TaxID=1738132 RepID=A0AAD7AWU2_9AGAR|nr:hypothetical protein FB45DRAFT_1047119 [Roridomyces roridus]